ncbi:hypothetical protein [Duganella sp. HH105]|uniref:hypothetical protein n=1 Tax=Duganella sp. HH105 TaxID=1781067 RepID=UPI00089374A8|nr:hypothetical protein [Duganella sp. HH105]OEZ54885.1 hypothetical protein DUGA6_56560 [Duganella sp. HH105]
MIPAFYPFCRFHALRLYRAHPFIVALCAAAMLLLLAAQALMVQEMQATRQAREEFDELRRAAARPVVAAPVAAPRLAAPTLPWFQSSDLVAQFNRVAEESKLPLDEVGYLLEEGGNHPYLRYRVTMTVAASYPAIRQFVSDVTSTMKHVDLDSISCTRADIVVAPLTCELAFSAFFRADAHG